jgi:pyrimidine-nucleoside phosphorylase
MLPQELIAKKRDGYELAPEELRYLLDEYGAGRLPDYQMSAFLMAVLLRDLSASELLTLTRAIISSGSRLDFRADGGPPAVGKHSTGGVGDKVSLILAPLLAEYGLRVPMMSGQGLGHTGGTLDKLESIPGFRTTLSLDEFHAALSAVGCAMIRQTPELAPLDGRLYSLRDVTATVPSIPLIAASIISKKVAEGTEALVLDVKCGSGAFMSDADDAVRLAEVLVELAAGEGLGTTALITAMDQPLGRMVGNALEVTEALDCLQGGGPADLRQVTLALAAEAVVAVEPGTTHEEATDRLASVLDRGSALERFRMLVEAQGGDGRIVEDSSLLPRAPVSAPLPSPADGFVGALDAYGVGVTSVELGAGRRRIEDTVDPAVGIELLVEIGDPAVTGEPLAIVHARSDEDAAAAAARLVKTCTIVPEPPAERPPLIRQRVTSG